MSNQKQIKATSDHELSWMLIDKMRDKTQRTKTGNAIVDDLYNAIIDSVDIDELMNEAKSRGLVK